MTILFSCQIVGLSAGEKKDLFCKNTFLRIVNMV